MAKKPLMNFSQLLRLCFQEEGMLCPSLWTSAEYCQIKEEKVLPNRDKSMLGRAAGGR